MNVLRNGLLLQEDESVERLLHNGLSLYEVFRVFHGHVIFQEDNIARLANSIRKAGWDIPLSSLDIAVKLEQLIRVEKIVEGNIKYVLCSTARGVDEYMYRIPHNYPNEADYREGVPVVTLRASRENAEIKYIHSELREVTNQLIHEQGVYEVLLIDKDEYITEGSRSNVFFIRENKLYTAPLPHVLPGTTRKRVLELCMAENIPVIEQRVAYPDIRLMQAAFLTGTSPLVLPIRQIDRLTMLDAHDPLLQRLMERYFSLLH
jgi:branched-chain amino acid aminotransferase